MFLVQHGRIFTNFRGSDYEVLIYSANQKIIPLFFDIFSQTVGNF